MSINIDINKIKTEILRGKDMSTYAIADAIEKFAKNFKEVVSEKNKIEKEKSKKSYYCSQCFFRIYHLDSACQIY